MVNHVAPLESCWIVMKEHVICLIMLCDMLNHVAHVESLEIMFNYGGLTCDMLNHDGRILLNHDWKTCDMLNHDGRTCYKLNHVAHVESWWKNMLYVVSCWIILNHGESWYVKRRIMLLLLNHIESCWMIEEHVIYWIMM